MYMLDVREDLSATRLPSPRREALLSKPLDGIGTRDRFVSIFAKQRPRTSTHSAQTPFTEDASASASLRASVFDRSRSLIFGEVI